MSFSLVGAFPLAAVGVGGGKNPFGEKVVVGLAFAVMRWFAGAFGSVDVDGRSGFGQEPV